MKMRFSILIGLILFSGCSLKGQSYADSMGDYRKQYLADLVADPAHPIQRSQIKYISFYHPDESYRVWASYKETPGSVPFMVHTHSGKQKPYRESGILSFTIHDTTLVLHAYQRMNLVNEADNKDELFVPFNDLTNYESTYGGGRYIDLMVKDIKDGKVQLDFNKCYNPYCAYGDGFSCPIPPKENYLRIEIRAGEKAFQR